MKTMHPHPSRKEKDNECLWGHWIIIPSCSMKVMNSHGPRNLSCRRKAAVPELGQPAQGRSWCVYTHIYIIQRCAILLLQLLSMLTANKTVMPHPAVMTCLCFQRPPLPKQKNTFRILKHTSQNKGSKVGAKALCTMKPRDSYEQLS